MKVEAKHSYSLFNGLSLNILLPPVSEDEAKRAFGSQLGLFEFSSLSCFVLETWQDRVSKLSFGCVFFPNW